MLAVRYNRPIASVQPRRLAGQVLAMVVAPTLPYPTVGRIFELSATDRHHRLGHHVANITIFVALNATPPVLVEHFLRHTYLHVATMQLHDNSEHEG